jgi:hypothetical protein
MLRVSSGACCHMSLSNATGAVFRAYSAQFLHHHTANPKSRHIPYDLQSRSTEEGTHASDCCYWSKMRLMWASNSWKRLDAGSASWRRSSAEGPTLLVKMRAADAASELTPVSVYSWTQNSGTTVRLRFPPANQLGSMHCPAATNRRPRHRGAVPLANVKIQAQGSLESRFSY